MQDLRFSLAATLSIPTSYWLLDCSSLLYSILVSVLHL